MTVHTLDPLRDPRWAEFVDRHESASVFHTVPWLQAIRRTYGYTPVVYTTSAPSAPLTNGVVLCQIRSWLTGRRMVSLPFSDHCEPLLDNADVGAAIFHELRRLVAAGKWHYVELRPLQKMTAADGAVDTPPFYLHVLDLEPTAEQLFKGFHKDCVQRKVRRAEREQLEYQTGNTKSLVEAFYRLMILTRRKHQLPPQPIEWFHNLAESMGDKLAVKIAFKDGKEVAGILTLQHGSTMVYKYGASDQAFANMGGTPLLFWKAISEAKEAGLTSLDLGRSDTDNEGLIDFKNRLGAKSTMLSYQRWSRKQATGESKVPGGQFAKQLFSVMPDPVLRVTGRILYRHVG
ncbi:MAG: lipid II:glycine glycyltransferase FemX [Acidobacteriota bacterium]